jgi:hypothetical protein
MDGQTTTTDAKAGTEYEHASGCQKGDGPARSEGMACLLCAAAPDLLRALKSALKGLEIDGARSATASLRIEGRAAVARAEGRAIPGAQ